MGIYIAIILTAVLTAALTSAFFAVILHRQQRRQQALKGQAIDGAISQIEAGETGLQELPGTQKPQDTDALPGEQGAADAEAPFGISEPQEKADGESAAEDQNPAADGAQEEKAPASPQDGLVVREIRRNPAGNWKRG